MTGYRDDRETLLRRIEELEVDLAEAKAGDQAAAQDLTSLREEREATGVALKRAHDEADQARQARARLGGKLASLQAEMKGRPTVPTERVAWAAVAALLVFSLLAALRMPTSILVVAGVALAIGFGLYAVSLRNVARPPPEGAPRERTEGRALRARVEANQRQEEARVSSKRRSPKRRRRRR